MIKGFFTSVCEFICFLQEEKGILSLIACDRKLIRGMLQ